MALYQILQGQLIGKGGLPTRNRWTTPQKKAALTAFKTHIKNGVMPGKGECLQFLENQKGVVNENRSWQNVKDCVRNDHKNGKELPF